MLMKKVDLNKELEEKAIKVGLNIIDDSYYKLVKIDEKNKSPYGYPDKFIAGKGRVHVIGSSKAVAILVENTQDYFRTSEVISCKGDDGDYVLETLNSYYRLERLNG